ncbi:glutamyl-tRNA reductase [Leucobacter soli]|uniref:Glutamyl-tRNA reductase n=1 Tax=Leucobacter soli TaxID=2812850 RepID=A0A916JVX0_9MICO|nr:glutamyl-tRNA reductase [Leucobacter soli]CAG7609138.1 Glutamyl-tRNA reductase [Leucobacter soli]
MLLSISFDHSNAPFALLERLARGGESIAVAVSDPSLSDGSIVLSTCNRFELYLDAPNAPDEATAGVEGEALGEAVIERIAGIAGVPGAEVRRSASVRADRRAVEHLFSVTAGLESVVLGEEEIAGQVRRAHAGARERGTVTHRLERLFQAAARTGRSVKQHTSVRSAGRSIVRFALDLVEDDLAPWPELPILLVGTGAYAGAVVTALRARGARRIQVHSPSGRAESYAAARGLEAVGAGGFADALAESELVIACSRVDEPLLTPKELVAPGPAATRVLVDLGMPRNIDPGVADLPNIRLLDLEEMASVGGGRGLGVEAEAARIVREAVEEFDASLAERTALPALLAVREHVLALLEDEVDRSRRGSRSGSGVVDTGESEAELALRRFAGRLLHDPMTRIRALGREGRAEQASDAVAALFGR